MATSSQQQTLQQSLERREKYLRNSKQWKKLINSVAYCITKDMMPFSTVERQGFKYMLSVLDEKYNIPCRKYISNTLFFNKRSHWTKTYRSRIFCCNYRPLVEYWSRALSHYTVHFINKSWELKVHCLQTVFVPDDHTGENVAEFLKMSLETWDLQQQKQVAITTDNGSNIIRAMILIYSSNKGSSMATTVLLRT